MYAVIENGGKQYKVQQGDILDVELMDVPGDSKTVRIDKVLFVNDDGNTKIGTPYLDKAEVVASFASGTAGESVVKGKKLYPAHFRKRKKSRRRIGHRQKYMQLKVDKIDV